MMSAALERSLFMSQTASESSFVLRRRMREVGVTQPKLAAIVGRAQSWVSMRLLINPEDTIRYLAYKQPQIVEKLAQALKWTVPELLQAVGIELIGQPDEEQFARHTRLTGYRLEPVLSAQAGTVVDDEQFPVPINLYRKGMKVFRIDGDSMALSDGSGINEGDIAFVDTKEKQLRHNHLFMIRIPGNGYFVKRARLHRGDWLLISDNQNYEPLKPDEAELVGLVYEVLGSKLGQ